MPVADLQLFKVNQHPASFLAQARPQRRLARYSPRAHPRLHPPAAQGALQSRRVDAVLRLLISCFGTVCFAAGR